MTTALHFLELTPKSWNTAKLIGNQLMLYSFRGQSDNNWPLATTIERLADQFSMPKFEIERREKRILENFKSRAHQYIQAQHTIQDNIEWLSILQDYGGPTRLLDFTHSFYVATFFALESAKDDACVWAISDVDLWNKFVVSHFSDIKQNATYSLSDTETCSKFAEKIITNETKSEDFIVKVIPPRVNERLAFQKGFFLFNCNANKSFEYSLCKTFKFPFDNLDYKHAFQFNSNEFLKEISTRNKTKDLSQNPLGHQAIAPLIRVKLSKKYQIQALTDLDNMNINHASLFPGIEGFAKSMKLNMLTTIKENIAFQYSTKKFDGEIE